MGAKLTRSGRSRCRVKPITFLPLFAAVAWFASVNRGNAEGNVIAPDGRTLTHVDVSGSVTNVTTGTVHNGTGINSFSQFQVGTGNTVNLHVPEAADKLLNIVRDAPVYVDGILNGYKDGKIGGDIYFADSHGFVVGPNGTVNAGSLTVQTPKAETLERLIDAKGNVDDATAAALLAGTTPVSPDGLIVVQGKINTERGVHLSGQTISVGKTIPPATPADIAKALFAATVNVDGMKEGAAITVRNGAIVIEAAGDAMLGGAVEANGAADHDAGSIGVTSGNDIRLTSDARLSAAGGGGTSNAGSVAIKAEHDLNVEAGAAVNVHGVDRGKGGSIELSARGTASISAVTLDAGADHAAAGSVLIDPTVVTIGAGGAAYPTLTPNIPADVPSIASNGASVTISADNSITIASGGYINTRRTSGSGNDTTSLSTGNSGDITLVSPQIQVDGQLNAFVLNTTGAGATTFTPGNITLTAHDSHTNLFGYTSGTAGIVINGTLSGGIIDLEANATAISKLDVGTDVFASSASSLFGAGVGYVDGTAHAAIQINNGASVTGTGDVTLNAWTVATAADPVFVVDLVTGANVFAGKFVPSVVVGNVTASANAEIATNATVVSGGLLTLRAHNTADLDISTFTVTTSVPVDASVAYSTADVRSNALIDSGAHITANSLRIAARNDNSFSTEVSVYDLGDGNAGIAVAIADGHHSTATALLGASPTLNGIFPANSGTQVSIEAENLTSTDAVGAKEETGTSTFARPFITPVQNAVQVSQDKAGNKVSSASGADPVSTPKLGAATALALDNEQSATATISGAGTIVTATGPVAVIAHTLDEGVRSEGEASVNAPNAKAGTAPNPSASFSLSAAVAYAERTLKADAEIGTEVQVSAPEIGVAASTELPITITWLDWDGFDAVLSHLNGTLGLAGDVLTSFVSSKASASEVGFSGAVNYFSVDASATAWVGRGAVLTGTTSNISLPWSVTLDTGEDASVGKSGTASQQSFSADLEVAARRNIATLNFGGDPLFFYSGTNGGQSDAAVFGGTFDYYKDSGATLAGIGDSAVVATSGDLTVLANANDKAITVSPAGGKGAGINGSLIVGINDVETKTHASIASTASVSAANLRVDADQVLSLWSAAGSIIRGDEASIGVAEADNWVETDVKAVIGDNSADDPSAALLPDFVTAPFTGVTTIDLSVNATTEGQLGAYAIAGTYASNKDQKPKDNPGRTENLKEAWAVLKDKITKLFGKASDDGEASAKNSDNSNAGKDGPQKAKGSGTPTPPDFGVAVSGSVGFNLLHLNTVASIDGASITKISASPGSVDVTAKWDTFITAVAGGAALVKAKASSSEENAAFAGSAAIIISNSTTDASITGSTLSGFNTVTVDALSGGLQIAAAIDLAANWSTTAGSQNYQGAGAASVADITDGVQATVNNSTITGPINGTSRAVVLNAYDRTDIGLGGGALYLKLTKQNGSSGGVALTYAGIHDPDGKNAVDASLINSTIDHYDTLDVTAADTDRIIAGAAMVAGSKKGSGGEGAIAISDIDATTNAEISADAAHAATSSVNITGNVFLSATGSDKPALDAIVGSAGLPQSCGDDDCTTQTDAASPIDFSGGSLGLTLAPGFSIISAAGTVAISTQGASKANIGGSLAVNTITAGAHASIFGLSVTSTGGNVTVAAGDDAKITAFAIGVAESSGGGFNGVGSVALNFINDSAVAVVGDPAAASKTTTVSSNALNMMATNDSSIQSLSGSVLVWQQKAFGVSISYNEIGDDTTAEVLWSKLTQTGAIVVSADSTSSIQSLAATLGLTSGWIFAGAATVNIIDDNVAALIGDSAAPSESANVTAGSVTLQADNSASIQSITAGTLGISFNQTGDTIAARISHAAFDIAAAGAVTATARNESSIEVAALGAAFGDSKSYAFAGSVAINLIGDTIAANWIASSLNDPALFAGAQPVAGLGLLAFDDASIQALAGEVDVSGQASGGASIAYSNISNTTTAHLDGTGGSKVRSLDTIVQAASDDDIRTLALGVAVSDSKFAATGSSATSLISSGTYAIIDNGADVIADNNIGVLAHNDDAIETIAGAAGVGGGSAGVGISVVVNEISDTTKASIEGASTKVDAKGASGTDLLTVDSGALLNMPDLSTISAPTATTPDLSESQKSVRGLAVVATSGQAAVTNAVTLGVGKTAVALVPVVNIIGGSSIALIEAASIDTRLTADPTADGYVAPDIDVTAGSHSYAGNFAMAVGGGQYAGAVTATEVTFDRTTDAHISNAIVGTKFATQTSTDNGDGQGNTVIDKTLVPVAGNVTISAQSSQDAASIAVAGAAGEGALTASVVVDLFSATIKAYVTGGSLTANSLTVKTDSNNDANGFGGAFAIGSGAGGGAFAVITNDDTTLSYVGDRANVLGSGTITPTLVMLSGATDVEAANENRVNGLVVSGAGGYTAGVAAMAAVTIQNANTDAGLYGLTLNPVPVDVRTQVTDDFSTQINPDNPQSTDTQHNTIITNDYSTNGRIFGPAGNVTVKASESDDIAPIAGSIAVGGVGVGLGANVVVLHSRVNAAIAASTVNAAGHDISVQAASDKHIQATEFAGAIGYSAGISAVVGVVLVGTQASSDVNGQLDAGGNGTITNVDSITSGTDYTGSNPSLSDSEAMEVTQTSAVHVAAPVFGGLPDSVTASINGGSVAGNNVTVTAGGTTSTSNMAVGVAAGGYAGVGGAVAYTRVHDTIVAAVDDSAVTASNLTVSANMADGSRGAAGDAHAIAGGGGLVGLGAGVADVAVDNSVVASVGGTITGNATGAVSITAEDQSSTSAQTEGGAAGAVAVGIMVSIASKTSTVNASTDPDTQLNHFNSVTVSATNSGSVDTSAEGVGGGGFVGTGVGATSTDTANVTAMLGARSEIPNATGLVDVHATDTPDVEAEALGVAVASGAGLGISVALASASPTVTAVLDDDVTVSGSGALSIAATAATQTGEDSAHASARSGTGGYLLALAGSIATAKNNAAVIAKTNTDVGLPDGDVTVDASNTTSQNAYANGISVGSVAGGAAYGEADSSGTTTARLGVDSWSNLTRDGALRVTAEGADTNYAKADAGTYGLAAGNASLTKTSDNSAVSASLGGGSVLTAGLAVFGATHADKYSEHSDSEAVSVAGTSGANAEHDADVSVTVTFEDGATLTVGDRLGVTAENDFARLDGDSAVGGSGGVFAGAGVKADTGIQGTSNVNIGSNVLIVAGTDPIVDPGRGINILAASRINGSDTVSLTTGGGLLGSGTENDFDAQLANNVDVGSNAILLSYSDIGIGTFTQTEMTVRSLASSFGIGAIANATAHLDISSTQSVVVESGSTLFAYGNIGLTPGQSATGSQSSDMQSSAQAVSYVRAIVPIPIADAESTLTNNVSLDIQPGAFVESGQNTAIGAYVGNVVPIASGDAQAYIAGLIPVTGGTDHQTPITSSLVTVNGTVIAGVVHEISVTIPDCANDGIFCSVMNVTAVIPPGITTSPGNYAHDYTPATFVRNFFTGDTESFLLQNVPADGVTVGAVVFNPLYASGGQVLVNSDRLVGTGSITAYGAPAISVTNQSPDYAQFGAITIPDVPGGHISFSGTADKNAALAAGIAIAENNPDGPGAITLTDTYTAGVGGISAGPAIFLSGSIQGLGATLSIKDPTGSLAQAATINVATLIVDVPLGVDVIQLSDGAAYASSGSIYSAWAPFIVMPGSAQGVNGIPSANWAVAYAVNSVYNPAQDMSFTSPEVANFGFISVPVPGTEVSGLSATLANLFATPHDGINGVTIVAYGRCFTPAGVTESCDPSTAKLNSPLGLYNRIQSEFSGFAGSGQGGFSAVPVACIQISCLTIQRNDVPASSSPSAINANQVIIDARYIDIDSKITVGAPTNWSVSLPSFLTGQITADQNAYDSGRSASQFFPLNATVVNAADSQIEVWYDALSRRIVVDNVTASAPAAASIKLSGGIIGTTTLGDIHVNAGLGQVTIDNATGTEVEVQDVYTGVATRSGGVTGSVEIYDTLQTSGPNHWWYIYTPGTGTDVYSATGAAATVDGATLQSSNSAQSFLYTPQSGLRWQWQQMAFLGHDVSNAPNSVGDWFFTDPTGLGFSGPNANPWYWVDTLDPLSAVAASNNTLFSYLGTVLTKDPGRAGVLTTGNDPAMARFVETISGTVNVGKTLITNADCMWRNDRTCYAFDTNPGNPWYSEYLGSATLTVTVSVKADNPFHIDFGGTAAGTVIVNSNAPVTIDGLITNPNGTTTIAATTGGIQSSIKGDIITGNLNLTAATTIGSSAQPLNASLSGGTLNAAAPAGVYLDLSSAVNIGHITALNGNVMLKARGNIAGTGGGTQVTGNVVTLQSVNGAIGTALAPVTIKESDRLNATALHDINIEQITGNLAVGEVQSIAGDIKLTADTGTLIDANGTTAAGALDDTQVQDIWSTLHLTAAYHSVENAANSVTALETNVNSTYQQYWVLLTHGSVHDGIFVLDTPSEALYGGVAAASGATAQTYANGLYQNFVSVFAADVGADWQSKTPFTAFDSIFHFSASSDQVTQLTGNATWTEGELTSFIPLAALAPSQSTAVGSATPNASGHILTLDGSQGIGTLAPSLPITIQDLRNGTLSTDQKKALTLAKTPGDVLVGAADSNGVVQYYALDALPAGAVISGIQIRQTAPFFVDASTRVDAHAASGGIYLQESNGSMKIGTITADAGDVSLTAPISLLNSAGPSVPFRISGDAISLLAGSGNIGAAGDAIAYRGAALASASAGGALYVDAFGGNMVIGRVFAGDTAVLEAPSGAINPSLSGTAIQAKNLLLRAGAGAIGSVAAPLQVDVSNSLNGSATGAFYLFAPQTAIHIGDVSTGGDLGVTANIGLTAGTLTSLGGNVTVASGGDAALDEIDAMGQVDVTVSRAAVLGQIRSSLNADHAVTIHAGTISGNGDGRTNIVANGAAAKSYLTAANGIGTASLPITTDTPWLNAMTTAGGIYLAARSPLIMPSIVAPGAFSLAGNGTLTLESITAAGNVTLNAAGAILFTDITSGRTTILTSGDAVTGHNVSSETGIAIAAVKDVTFTQLSSSTGDVSANSLSGAIHGGSVTAGGAITLNALGTITFGDIDAGGAATVTAGGDIVGQHIASATGAVTIASTGTFHVDDLKAAGLNLTSNSELSIDNLKIENQITISAPEFSIQLVNIGAGPLVINAGGRDGKGASSGALSVDSPGGVVFSNYNVANGTIQTNAENVVIQNSHITGVVTLTTPDAVLLLDNTSPASRPGYAAQLFAPGFDLVLVQNGTHTLTNAYVASFDSTHTVTVTNFTGTHTDSDTFVTGVALTRDVARLFGDNFWSESHQPGQSSGDSEILLIPGSLLPIDMRPAAMLATPLGLVPVNLVRN